LCITGGANRRRQCSSVSFRSVPSHTWDGRRTDGRIGFISVNVPSMPVDCGWDDTGRRSDQGGSFLSLNGAASRLSGRACLSCTQAEIQNSGGPPAQSMALKSQRCNPTSQSILQQASSRACIPGSDPRGRSTGQPPPAPPRRQHAGP